jgi:hypothetical protein
MTETPRDPDGPDPALVRLLRRRTRKERHGRALSGKSFRSWAEYSPKSLRTTGDHSDFNRWAYVAVFCLAVLIVPFLIALLGLESPEMATLPLSWKLAAVLKAMAPFLIAVSLLLTGLVLDSLRRQWRSRRSGTRPD